MRDSDWNLLLARIRDGKCTPFLGAGASAHRLPLGANIASRWAADHGYPLDDVEDLARVAQFLAVDQDDAMSPKELLTAEFRAITDTEAPTEIDPHPVLASLPLPLYLTTNYDDAIFDALI